MKKSTLMFVTTVMAVVLVLGSGFALAQQSGTSTVTGKVPEKVNISLDALLKTRTPNGVFNLKDSGSYFFASQGSVFANVLFTGDLDQDMKELKAKDEADYAKLMDEYNKFVAAEEAKLEETNKKIREKNKNLQESKRIPEKTWEKPAPPQPVTRKAYHNLFLRVVQDGKVVQEYKSPIPFDENPTEYYSFGLILVPGKYDILMNIDRFDNSQDGTLLVELEVPQLTLESLTAEAKKITTSVPSFYRQVNSMSSAETRFTVVKNCYQIAPLQQEFIPYVGKENVFKSGDSPTLTFFLLGIKPPWNVEGKLEIKEGKKSVVAFKVPPMQNPYFFQPLEFKDKDKKALKAGEYLLTLDLVDSTQKSRKGTLEVPFKIVE